NRPRMPWTRTLAAPRAGDVVCTRMPPISFSNMLMSPGLIAISSLISSGDDLDMERRILHANVIARRDRRKSRDNPLLREDRNPGSARSQRRQLPDLPQRAYTPAPFHSTMQGFGILAGSGAGFSPAVKREHRLMCKGLTNCGASP